MPSRRKGPAVDATPTPVEAGIVIDLCQDVSERARTVANSIVVDVLTDYLRTRELALGVS